MNQLTVEYRLKGLYSTTAPISWKTMVNTLKTIKACGKTYINNYSVLEDGVEYKADEWLKNNTFYERGHRKGER